MAKILAVDDEPGMIAVLRANLGRHGHAVSGARGGGEALAALRREPFDLVITDLRMEPLDGFAVLDGVKADSPGTPVIVLTGHGDVPDAVRALRGGAYGFLQKPCDFEALAALVTKALGEADLARENRALRRAVAAQAGGAQLVGDSAAMAGLRELIGKVAATEATVLIRGESGVGKELVARALHDGSPRAGGPFIAVNCAAIAETLLESELFGYRKGAFTGADRDREGLFEAARGGTLFLDEIGEAGLPVQAKLLRVLEERKINRVGDPREREVDARIVAATNRPLEPAIAAGRFREDLYYRLLVFPLDVPPLRQRCADIAALAQRFLDALGRRGPGLEAATVARLRAHAWPGNVRELRNVIERAHILAGSGPLRDEHVVIDVRGAPAPGDAAEPVPAELNLEGNERRLIRAALARADGNKSLAARLLGITRRTLYSRLKLLGMAADPEPGDDEPPPGD
ncbi:MAG: sigma-54-dependent transcriptional regulator [Candidatus Krumholzibacteriia bacterium]